jgi:exopolyphosphatase / guanosine-5'-triphosphate,3'-diphosphate pyrophosphatase
MKLLKFAAIDIGSNAVRLLFMNVIEDKEEVYFKKSELIRMPVRLGEDSFFGDGIIRDEKIESLLHTISAFRHLMLVQKVVSFRACATSAMREATNSASIVEYIRERTGISIEIIDGHQEAELIYSNRIVEMINNDRSYLYVDVGGGSTELTLFSNRKIVDSGSFNIGTIRFLNGEVSQNEFARMKAFIKELTAKYKPIDLIGSGGNINKVFKLSGKKDGVPLSVRQVKTIYTFLSSFSIEERIKELGFNPDRADVIIPATELFLKLMKWTKAKRILIPKIGVSDGIVHQLYNDYILKRDLAG